MSRKYIFHIFMLLIMLLLSCSNQSRAESFLLQTSLLTHHWGDNSLVNNKQQLLNIEYHRPDNRLCGIARFKNSFNQLSYYLYTGKSYKLKETPPIKIRGKITYGIIHGYDDEDGKHQSIYARLGTFPALIPILGLKLHNLEISLMPFSIEGLMLTVGIWF